MSSNEVILDVKNLQTYFHTRNGIVKAVDGLNFQLKKGQCLGVVGESGSGKSVSMMSVMGLLPTPPAKIEADYINFKGENLLNYNETQMRQVRGSKISMIFQDPMTSLNPYLTIATQMTEAITCLLYTSPSPRDRG